MEELLETASCCHQMTMDLQAKISSLKLFEQQILDHHCQQFQLQPVLLLMELGLEENQKWEEKEKAEKLLQGTSPWTGFIPAGLAVGGSRVPAASLGSVAPGQQLFLLEWTGVARSPRAVTFLHPAPALLLGLDLQPLRRLFPTCSLRCPCPKAGSRQTTAPLAQGTGQDEGMGHLKPRCLRGMCLSTLTLCPPPVLTTSLPASDAGSALGGNRR